VTKDYLLNARKQSDTETRRRKESEWSEMKELMERAIPELDSKLSKKTFTFELNGLRARLADLE
jgi:hypothetical protein